MLIFIDESGDTGRKLEQGSSNFFLIALVAFEEREEAVLCDKRIDLLRHELGKKKDFEFHFSKNSRDIRKAFLEAVYPYQYSCFSIAIDKNPEKLWGDGFNKKDSFYKYACHLVFENAKPYLNNAVIIIDKSGGKEFEKKLTNYLKRKVNTEERLIKKVKQQESHKNNLIQLADYCASIYNRKVQNKKDADEYYKYISPKEIRFQVWPPK